MTWFLRLFRRADPLPRVFLGAMIRHIDATTHDGVGRWYHRGKS